MAINLYIGLMGSGKSYETVRSVIVPAIKSGRRVVTNVAGLKYDAIIDYLKSEYKDFDESKAGELCEVTTDELLEPGSLPKYIEGQQAEPGKYVFPGDMLVIDECWKLYPPGSQKLVPDEHKSFLRMHRHITRHDGLSCEVVLISQQKSDINRFVAGVVQMIVRTVKLVQVGSDKSYRVEFFSGNVNPDRTKPDQYKVHRYSSKIFPLYSSYSGGSGDGVEVQSDSRVNVLAGSWLIKLGLPFALLLFIAGSYYLYNYFANFGSPDEPEVSDVSEVDVDVVQTGASPEHISPGSTSSKSFNSRTASRRPSESRLLATYTVNGVSFALLHESNSAYRYITTPDAVAIAGPEVSVTEKGYVFNPWSGGPVNSKSKTGF